MSDNVTTLQAAATSAGIAALTGAQPTLSMINGKTTIYWEPAQQIILQNWIKDRLSREGGNSGYSIEIIPAIWPVILEKGLPIIAGLFLAGFLVGRYAGK